MILSDNGTYVTAVSTSSTVLGNRGRHVSSNTVRCRLRKCGINCQRPYRGMVLTECHRWERGIWAQNNINHQWRTVVFSHESRFNLSHADGQARLYQCQNEHFAPNCVLQHNRYGGGGVKVWAAINQHFKTELVIFQGNLMARQYKD